MVYVPPTITYFYGFKRTLIRVDIIDIHHFSKSGFSGFSGTVKYLALCQILTPLIESSPFFSPPGNRCSLFVAVVHSLFIRCSLFLATYLCTSVRLVDTCYQSVIRTGRHVLSICIPPKLNWQWQQCWVLSLPCPCTNGTKTPHLFGGRLWLHVNAPLRHTPNLSI